MRETAISYTHKTRRVFVLILTVCMILVSGAGFSSVPVQAASNETQIYEYLTQELGYSTAAACGIMANIWCESSFKPTAYNSGGGSYGLCQWLGGRLSRLRSFCKENGYDSASIKGQLEFLNHELEGGYSDTGDFLKNVDNTEKGAGEAAEYWCIHFEKPADKYSKAKKRASIATGTYWKKYKGDAIDQWIEKDGHTYYRFKTGDYQKGWFTLDGATYYFDDDGVLQTGLQTVDGEKYYFDDDGKMTTGWQTIDGEKYYFDDDGKMVTGWQDIDGGRYYFDSDSKMVTGWQDIDGGKYHFDDDGKMATGWQTVDGTKYYFGEDGIMQPVTVEVNGQKYFVDENGEIQTDNTINSRIDDTAAAQTQDEAQEADSADTQETAESAGTEAAAAQATDN